jgi:membrane-bound lytic murein transglycosylase B
MSPATRTPPRLLGAALAAAVLVVGACSGDGDGAARAEATTSTSTTSAPTTTAPPTTTTAPAPTTTLPSPAALTFLRPPAAADDPTALAAQISAAELTIRDPAADVTAVGNAALSQQVAYRKLARRPEWLDAVLAAVPEHLRWGVGRNYNARREFESMHTARSTTVPAWQIVPPETPELLLATYQEAAAAFGLPWPYLAAIHLVETGTGRIRGTSSAGAQGPMQFLPSTWAAFGGGGDINSTRDSIFAAARYLAHNGGATDMAPALWNYNHSDHYVRGVTLYAEAIAEHPLAFRGFYSWGIWYITNAGDAFLPVGYATSVPVSAAAYIDGRPPFGA